VIHWTVCVVHIIILKVIFGVGKLSSALASASKFCPRPRLWPRRFVLGLGLGLENLSSFNITGKSANKQTENCIIFSNLSPS